MGQKKLQRFAELETFDNVLQYPEHIKGAWKDHFKNNHPLVLELACGKGEYTLGLAQLYPQKNFIGVDVKGNRLWVGARKARQQQLENVAFLRIQIERLTEYFGNEEVDEIWITFPDPQLRISKAKKRLTHPRFLRLYQQVLKPGGKIHLKTDSPDLYQFTKEVMDICNCSTEADLDHVYASGELSEELKIKTHYESLDIAGSNRIHYLRFTLPPVLPGKDADMKLQESLKQQHAAEG